jgi:3-oxoacyl-[acyl-carrier protein] reductase
VSDAARTVAIVTGGANGIGSTYCRRLAAAGHAVCVADVDFSGAQTLAHDIGPGALAIACDVSDEQATLALVGQVERAFGGVDVLVNNAGIYPSSNFVDMTVDDWDRVLAVNLRGTFLCCKAVVPAMRRRGGGRIVNVSSSTVFRPLTGLSHYISSKMGLIGLTRALAVELGQFNINVNAISPGITRGEEAVGGRGGDALMAVVRGQVFQRPATPQDLASAVLFLTSNDSSFITGQVLNVDGGWTFPS